MEELSINNAERHICFLSEEDAKEENQLRAKTAESRQAETEVINFLADKLKNDSEYYQKIKVILRKIIQETMTHYVTQISQKKYLSNIDFHHLPNSCATHILNDFKNDSQKYL